MQTEGKHTMGKKNKLHIPQKFTSLHFFCLSSLSLLLLQPLVCSDLQLSLSISPLSPIHGAAASLFKQ